MDEKLYNIPVETARDYLLAKIKPTATENIPIEEANNRVAAEAICSNEMVPPFPRSPFDGYALRGEDTAGATAENPVILRITEEIPAGKAPQYEVHQGEAAKILTGGPVPVGANATLKYEDTEFTPTEVKIFKPVKPNSNVVPAGEDIKIGDILAEKGTVITPPIAGVLAGIGVAELPVHKKPVVAIISTGSELVSVHEKLEPAKIRNTSYYVLKMYLENAGAEVLESIIAVDTPDAIASALNEAVAKADLILTTGGVSVGDYDFLLTTAENLGGEILFRKVKMKPGSAMLSFVYKETPVLSLSGNPAASILGFFMVGLPAVYKMTGRKSIHHKKITVTLGKGFKKSSPQRRFVRGYLEVQNSQAVFMPFDGQGNGMVSSLIGCDLLGEIPEGSGPKQAGEQISAYRI